MPCWKRWDGEKGAAGIQSGPSCATSEGMGSKGGHSREVKRGWQVLGVGLHAPCQKGWEVKGWEAKGGKAGQWDVKGWAFMHHVRRDGMGRGAQQDGKKGVAGTRSGPLHTTSEGKGREGGHGRAVRRGWQASGVGLHAPCQKGRERGVREGSRKVRGSRHWEWAFAHCIGREGWWGRVMER